MPKTMSWSMRTHEEGDDVTHEPPDEPKDRSELRTLVDEVEDIEARVRSRSQRIRASSVSPDAPILVDDAPDEPPYVAKTLPPPSADGTEVARSSSVPPPDPALGSEARRAALRTDPDARRGRYSYVGRVREKK